MCECVWPPSIETTTMITIANRKKNSKNQNNQHALHTIVKNRSHDNENDYIRIE